MPSPSANWMICSYCVSGPESCVSSRLLRYRENARHSPSQPRWNRSRDGSTYFIMQGKAILQSRRLSLTAALLPNRFCCPSGEWFQQITQVMFSHRYWRNIPHPLTVLAVFRSDHYLNTVCVVEKLYEEREHFKTNAGIGAMYAYRWPPIRTRSRTAVSAISSLATRGRADS
jgi:hypothetical protein